MNNYELKYTVKRGFLEWYTDLDPRPLTQAALILHGFKISKKNEDAIIEDLQQSTKDDLLTLQQASSILAVLQLFPKEGVK